MLSSHAVLMHTLQKASASQQISHNVRSCFLGKDIREKYSSFYFLKSRLGLKLGHTCVSLAQQMERCLNPLDVSHISMWQRCLRVSVWNREAKLRRCLNLYLSHSSGLSLSLLMNWFDVRRLLVLIKLPRKQHPC